jgi:glutamate 5-kinase
VIARGRRPDVILDVAAGAPIGTWFPPAAKRPDSRRLWLAFAHQPAGRLQVDHGAVRALTSEGASLLAIGVTGIHGNFQAGDAVDLLDPDGHPVARGVVGYDAATILRMKGLGIQALADMMGPEGVRPVMHRDQLVVTA